MALTDKLTAIADAIRAKTGSTAKLTLEQMPAEIAGISGGDSDEIKEAVVARSFTTFSSNATKIGDYALAGCASLTEVNFPKATSTGKNSFAYCNSLTSVDFPSLTSIGNQSFFNCAALVSVNFPNVTTLSGQSVSYCDKLTKMVLPKVTRVAQNAFTYNRGLKIIDLPSATNIVTGAFGNCTVLTALVLRSATLCTLGNTAAFTNCYHLLGTTNATYNPNGDKDCYIYVPRALVDTYKSNSVWSTYASQFRALEDYTVDGTITGEFSENGPEGGLLDSNGNYLYDILQNKLITKEE